MNYKLHTPVGTKDFLPKDLRYKKEIENRIEKVFSGYGYELISSPMFEFLEVFTGPGEKGIGKIFKFLDRDGATLALRTDMTPPIARIISTNNFKSPKPYRFSYIENSFRNTKTLQGKSREFTQAGIELIGDNSAVSDAEVISTAINSLTNSGLSEFKITLGQVQFLNGVLEEVGFKGEKLETVQNLILKREFVELEEIISNLEINPNLKKILIELQFFKGGVEVLNEAESLINNKKSLEAIKNLKDIYEILNEINLQKYISFDLSTIGHFDYYTGIIFNAYSYGTGFSILDGGRYDNLISEFGEGFPAVGFAIKVDDLMDSLQTFGVKFETDEVETLIAYQKDGRKNALQTADELRRQGLIIENSLVGEDIEKNKDFARQKNIGGIFYFKNEDKVLVIDLVNDTETEVSLKELLN